MKDRHYSLAIPWFTDAALALMQTAVPFLALQLGASNIVLGSINWIAQTVRLPVCLTAGRLSEKVGRSKIIIPAACLVAIACLGLARAASNLQVVLYYTLAIAALGALYPPLQALIGDVSKHGELTKNLGMFNFGWCIGGASAALLAGWLLKISISTTFYVAAACGLGAGLTVIVWRNSPKRQPRSTRSTVTNPDQYPASLLFTARMAHFTGFFAFATIRMLFPKLALSFNWSTSKTAEVVAMLLVGQAIGIFATNTAPWWRGKYWPLIVSQFVFLTCALVVATTSNSLLIGTGFLVIGIAVAIGYTSALYHGISARKRIGKSTGIHESLVAGGNILGCLFGSLVAQHISPRAPYYLLAGLATACLISSLAIVRKRNLQIAGA